MQLEKLQLFMISALLIICASLLAGLFMLVNVNRQLGGKPPISITGQSDPPEAPPIVYPPPRRGLVPPPPPF